MTNGIGVIRDLFFPIPTDYPKSRRAIIFSVAICPDPIDESNFIFKATCIINIIAGICTPA
jgi:hypothetical protein